MATDFLDFEFLACFEIKGEKEAGNSVGILLGLNSVCKRKDSSQSGRNAAIVAIDILDQKFKIYRET